MPSGRGGLGLVDTRYLSSCRMGARFAPIALAKSGGKSHMIPSNFGKPDGMHRGRRSYGRAATVAIIAGGAWTRTRPRRKGVGNDHAPAMGTPPEGRAVSDIRPARAGTRCLAHAHRQHVSNLWRAGRIGASWGGCAGEG